MGYDFSNGFSEMYVSYNWSDYFYEKRIFGVREIYGKTGREAAAMIRKALETMESEYGAIPGTESKVDYYGAWKNDIPMFVGMNVDTDGSPLNWDRGIIKEINGDRVKVEWENVNGKRKETELTTWCNINDVKYGLAIGSLDRHVKFANILSGILKECVKFPDEVWNGD